jgi:hypothetical protein
VYLWFTLHFSDLSSIPLECPFLSILPETSLYPHEGYGYEAIAGAGVGMTIGILTLAIPFIVETKDFGTQHFPIVHFRIPTC